MRGPGRARDGIGLLIVMLVAFGPWIPYLTGSVVLFFGDTFYYFYPLRHTLSIALHAGFFPDWESTVLSGNPFCANPQSNCFYPLSLWYYAGDFFLDFHWALVTHLALGGAGVYIWLRKRGHAFHVALVVATVFLLGGPTLSMVNRLDKLQSLCWWPWVMVSWDMVAARRRWGVFWLAVTLALQFLAGGVEIWVMAVGAGFLWSLLAGPPPAHSAEYAGRPHLETEPIHGNDQVRPWYIERGRILTRGGVAAGIAILVTTPQWAGLLELLHWSTRARGVSFSRASAMSMSPVDLLSMLLPHLFFDPNTLSYVPIGARASVPHYFYSLYQGWLPMLGLGCALVAVFVKQRWSTEARAAFLIIAIALFMALGRYNPLYEPLFDTLSPLRAVRFPEKFFSMAAFFMLPAIAVGLERFRRPRQWFWLAVSAVATLLTIKLGQHVVTYLIASGSPFVRRAMETPWEARLFSLTPEISRSALLLMGAATAGYLVAVKPRAVLPSLAMVGVLSVDLWTETCMLNPPFRIDELIGTLKLAGPIRELGTSPRVHVLPLYQAGSLAYPDALDPLTSYRWLTKILYPNTALLDGLAYADGARALRIKHQTQFFSALKGAPIEVQLRAARAAGVDAIITTESTLLPSAAAGVVGKSGPNAPGVQARSGLTRVARDASYPPGPVDAWALGDSAPPAYLVHTCTWFLTPVTASSAVLAGRVDVRNTAALVAHYSSGVPWDWDTGTPACPGTTHEVHDDQAPTLRKGDDTAAPPTFERVPVVTQEGGKRKVLTGVNAGSGAVMVLPETWYPGWHARVDDQEVPVLMANGYQQAVLLPPGTHDVVLEFLPQGRHWQLAVAFIGLLVAVGTGVKRRRGTVPDTGSG